jgi:hypothetical protein
MGLGYPVVFDIEIFFLCLFGHISSQKIFLRLCDAPGRSGALPCGKETHPYVNQGTHQGSKAKTSPIRASHSRRSTRHTETRRGRGGRPRRRAPGRFDRRTGRSRWPLAATVHELRAQGNLRDGTDRGVAHADLLAQQVAVLLLLRLELEQPFPDGRVGFRGLKLLEDGLY